MNKASSYPVAGRGPVDHDVRDQIVAAAADHFSRYGYEKTAVSDLAKEIGFSKAYIYKFFASKQAIGEVICGQCLQEIKLETAAAVAQATTPQEKLRSLFKVVVNESLRLHARGPKLYEIATSASIERWPTVLVYEAQLQALLQEILVEGRLSGDFERKTPLDEASRAIYLMMRPYINPLLLQHSLEYAEEVPALLSSLVLRSLAP
ncbi:TetR/AcrR family transcriptional regulator [Xanthomonas euroxanthea]|uniref:TetR/AcrR family transcriptional regulator n=1 Tax=Xanthomonas euroxanthea TaxID=2259622 RepID=A0AA46C597_9XANT|nr:TetR/AcrR family transcriptional regulator [Xanthomonas euroxanthea]CAE1133061.1 TetR/AcrR family transcriptional regulator [Xanthomonas euroxanthea]SUZ26664.1 TetR/AcrR family transcriptional regulator [Xanthomonas euroxanthea]